MNGCCREPPEVFETSQVRARKIESDCAGNGPFTGARARGF